MIILKHNAYRNRPIIFTCKELTPSINARGTQNTVNVQVKGAQSISTLLKRVKPVFGCLAATILILWISAIRFANASEGAKETPEGLPFCLKTVVLDPGHGGRDPGKVSPWKVKEKDINLSVVLKLAQIIHDETEYQVFLTREADRSIPLSDRARFANQFPANQTLFISIHCNSHPNSRVSGVESYIFNLKATDKLAAKLAAQENAEEAMGPIDFIVNNLYQRGSEKYSWEAARCVQSALASRLKIRDRNRNASDKVVRRAPFRVLKETHMPAILIELGFLSNRTEHKKLTSSVYQEKIARALFASIQQFDRVTQELAQNAHNIRLP